MVHREGVTIEISPRSNNFFGVTSRQRHTTTLKISGAPCTTQEESLTTLEALGGAMLFEIDLRYGRPFDLTYQPRSPVIRRVRRSKELPSFPKNQYAVEPLALYNYGRAAFRLPLLEFLAYYQVLEYFFSIFTGQELIKQLRFSLKDPRFNLNDDVAVGRVLASISLNSRGATNERDQLRATVRACIDVAAIEDFVTSNSRIKDHFCSKSQVVKNVPRLIFAPGQPDYREQVADRLYAIRCRVVHTKQEGGDSGVDLLLPSSREAQALGADVELAKLLAQQALIVAATPVN